MHFVCSLPGDDLQSRFGAELLHNILLVRNVCSHIGLHLLISAYLGMHHFRHLSVKSLDDTQSASSLLPQLLTAGTTGAWIVGISILPCVSSS